MAIIYTYPETKNLVGNDLLVVSKYVDDTTLATNSVTLSTLAKFLNSAPKMGNGTNNYVTQWADGPNGILEDSPMFTFDGGAGLKQVILTDGYRFVVDRDAATTVGDPEYAITQNGVNKTSFGWDDDGGGFGFIYNWAGKGFKLGGAALYPQLELLTDPDIKTISFADFEFDADIIDITGSVGTAGQVLSSLGAGNGVQWVAGGSGGVTGTGTTDYFVKFIDGPNGVIGDVPNVLEQAGEVIFQTDVRFDDVVQFDGGTVSSFNNIEMLDGAAIKFQDSAGPVDVEINSVVGSNTLSISNNVSLLSDKKLNFGPSAYIEGTVAGSKIIVRASDDILFQPGNVQHVEFVSTGGVNLNSLGSYADDAAAGVGGVPRSGLYQTDGTGAAPLNVAGIVMIKQ